LSFSLTSSIDKGQEALFFFYFFCSHVAFATLSSFFGIAGVRLFFFFMSWEWCISLWFFFLIATDARLYGIFSLPRGLLSHLFTPLFGSEASCSLGALRLLRWVGCSSFSPLLSYSGRLAGFFTFFFLPPSGLSQFDREKIGDLSSPLLCRYSNLPPPPSFGAHLPAG